MTINILLKNHNLYKQGLNTWSIQDILHQIANPMLRVDFNSLSDGQSVVNTANDPGSVPGKRFTGVLGNRGFFGGFGVQADTAIKMDGATSSCMCSIAQGSDGDPAGGSTGASYGAFGGIIDIPNPVGEGEELWLGFWMYIPSNFNFATNTGLLKYIRMDTTNNVGRIEYMVVNGLYNGQPSSTQQGWALIREGPGNDKLQTETNFVSNRLLVKGEWNWVEMYMLASNDRNISTRRIWCNQQFVCERVGNVNKYINQSGNLITQTIGSGDSLLPSVTDTVTNVYFSTYWNGNSPQNQAWHIQRVIAHKQASDVTNMDQYGNKMMGPQL